MLAKMCRELVQNSESRSDVFEGTKYPKNGKDHWEWDSDDSFVITMEFLKKTGMFQFTEDKYGQVVLTAEHLSHIEFLAGVSCLQGDLNHELSKLCRVSYERFEAVTTHVR